MCFRLEFSRLEKANNRLTFPRLVLNIIGLLVVLCLATAAAVLAWGVLKWFPPQKGYDGIYSRIGRTDERMVNLTEIRAEDCTNYNQTDFMLDRLVYRCGKASTGVCIPMDNRCDGHVDCPGGDDEAQCEDFCKKAVRARIRFECDVLEQGEQEAVRKCIHTDYQCDGRLDCNANVVKNDELGCKDVFTLGSTGVECSVDNNWVCKDNLKCINRLYRCNGFNNCADGSDEMDCYKLK